MNHSYGFFKRPYSKTYINAFPIGVNGVLSHDACDSKTIAFCDLL